MTADGEREKWRNGERENGKEERIRRERGSVGGSRKSIPPCTRIRKMKHTNFTRATCNSTDLRHRG